MRCLIRAFTIVELLMLIAIIGVLIAILLPAIGTAHDRAMLMQSKSNLRQMGLAHQTYAADHAGRQLTITPDDFASYGLDADGAYDTYIAQTGTEPPDVLFGYVDDEGDVQTVYFDTEIYPPAYSALNFEGSLNYAGWHRYFNIRAFNQYLSGRVYDPVFYAPKDRLLLEDIAGCFENPGEYCWSTAIIVDGGETPIIEPGSYSLSPAALLSPSVMWGPAISGEGPWEHAGISEVDPWAWAAGLRTPPMSAASYPHLKTHMVEHHWLQNPLADCNSNNPEIFKEAIDGCTPYFFNQGPESRPAVLFYDGHVGQIGTTQAARHDAKTVGGLWLRETPWGEDGFLISAGVPTTENLAYATSFHILTRRGIKGRDVLGN